MMHTHRAHALPATSTPSTATASGLPTGSPSWPPPLHQRARPERRAPPARPRRRRRPPRVLRRPTCRVPGRTWSVAALRQRRQSSAGRRERRDRPVGRVGGAAAAPGRHRAWCRGGQYFGPRLIGWRGLPTRVGSARRARNQDDADALGDVGGADRCATRTYLTRSADSRGLRMDEQGYQRDEEHQVERVELHVCPPADQDDDEGEPQQGHRHTSR